MPEQEKDLTQAVAEALKSVLPGVLKEQGIEPPPPKEPENYNEFLERLKVDLPRLLSTQKEDPPADNGTDEGKGKRTADEPPGAVHPFFKQIGKSG